MAIAFVQTKNTVTSGTSTPTVVFVTSNCTTGNFISLTCNISSNVVLNSVTDSGSNSYTISVQTLANGTRVAIAWAQITGGGGTKITITMHLAGSAQMDATAYEFSGVATSSPVDQTAVSSSGTSTAVTSSAMATTSNANDLLIGCCMLGGTCTAATGSFTGGATADGNGSSYRIVSATGAYAATFTQTPSSTYLAAVASFKGAASTAARPGAVAAIATSASVDITLTPIRPGAVSAIAVSAVTAIEKTRRITVPALVATTVVTRIRLRIPVPGVVATSATTDFRFRRSVSASISASAQTTLRLVIPVPALIGSSAQTTLRLVIPVNGVSASTGSVILRQALSVQPIAASTSSSVAHPGLSQPIVANTGASAAVVTTLLQRFQPLGTIGSTASLSFRLVIPIPAVIAATAGVTVRRLDRPFPVVPINAVGSLLLRPVCLPQPAAILISLASASNLSSVQRIAVTAASSVTGSVSVPSQVIRFPAPASSLTSSSIPSFHRLERPSPIALIDSSALTVIEIAATSRPISVAAIAAQSNVTGRYILPLVVPSFVAATGLTQLETGGNFQIDADIISSAVATPGYVRRFTIASVATASVTVAGEVVCRPRPTALITGNGALTVEGPLELVLSSSVVSSATASLHFIFTETVADAISSAVGSVALTRIQPLALSASARLTANATPPSATNALPHAFSVAAVTVNVNTIQRIPVVATVYCPVTVTVSPVWRSIPSTFIATSLETLMAIRLSPAAVVFIDSNVHPDPSPVFIQNSDSGVPSGTATSKQAVLATQVVGNFNLVAVSFGNAAGVTVPQTATVTDTRGNTYVSAGPLTIFTNNGAAAIGLQVFYAMNIAAGANTVTATASGAVSFFTVSANEYAGVQSTLALDKTSLTVANSVGVGDATTAMSSGSVTTLNANDIIIGAGICWDGVTASGGGFTERDRFYTIVVEDQPQIITGAFTATATAAGPGGWVMQVLSFKGTASVQNIFVNGAITSKASASLAPKRPKPVGQSHLTAAVTIRKLTFGAQPIQIFSTATASLNVGSTRVLVVGASSLDAANVVRRLARHIPTVSASTGSAVVVRRFVRNIPAADASSAGTSIVVKRMVRHVPSAAASASGAVAITRLARHIPTASAAAATVAIPTFLTRHIPTAATDVTAATVITRLVRRQPSASSSSTASVLAFDRISRRPIPVSVLSTGETDITRLHRSHPDSDSFSSASVVIRRLARPGPDGSIVTVGGTILEGSAFAARPIPHGTILVNAETDLTLKTFPSPDGLIVSSAAITQIRQARHITVSANASSSSILLPIRKFARPRPAAVSVTSSAIGYHRLQRPSPMAHGLSTSTAVVSFGSFVPPHPAGVIVPSVNVNVRRISRPQPVGLIHTGGLNFVQKNLAQGISGSTGICSFLVPVSFGNTIVVGAIQTQSGTPTVISSVTDNAGNTYTQIVNNRDTGGSNATVAIYAAPIVLGAGTNVQVQIHTNSGNGVFSFIYEFSGLINAQIDIADGVSSGIGAVGTNISSGLLPVTSNNIDLIFGLGSALTNILTFESGWPHVFGSATSNKGAEYLITSSNGAYAATFVQAGASNYNSVAASFRAAAVPTFVTVEPVDEFQNINGAIGGSASLVFRKVIELTPSAFVVSTAPIVVTPNGSTKPTAVTTGSAATDITLVAEPMPAAESDSSSIVIVEVTASATRPHPFATTISSSTSAFHRFTFEQPTGLILVTGTTSLRKVFRETPAAISTVSTTVVPRIALRKPVSATANASASTVVRRFVRPLPMSVSGSTAAVTVRGPNIISLHPTAIISATSTTTVTRLDKPHPTAVIAVSATVQMRTVPSQHVAATSNSTAFINLNSMVRHIPTASTDTSSAVVITRFARHIPTAATDSFTAAVITRLVRLVPSAAASSSAAVTQLRSSQRFTVSIPIITTANAVRTRLDRSLPAASIIDSASVAMSRFTRPHPVAFIITSSLEVLELGSTARPVPIAIINTNATVAFRLFAPTHPVASDTVTATVQRRFVRRVTPAALIIDSALTQIKRVQRLAVIASAGSGADNASGSFNTPAPAAFIVTSSAVTVRGPNIRLPRPVAASGTTSSVVIRRLARPQPAATDTTSANVQFRMVRRVQVPANVITSAASVIAAPGIYRPQPLITSTSASSVVLRRVLLPGATAIIVSGSTETRRLVREQVVTALSVVNGVVVKKTFTRPHAVATAVTSSSVTVEGGSEGPKDNMYTHIRVVDQLRATVQLVEI